jgi:hypothetical protein
MCVSTATFPTANSCPRDHRNTIRDLDALLIWTRDSQREGFPWSHGQIPSESPAGTREIPDGALAWKEPALYVIDQCTGKRRLGRIEKGVGALQGGLL